MAISLEQALAIAGEYVASQQPYPGWKYVVGSWKELADDWYFDHCIVPTSPETDQSGDGFGGAPGFFISKRTGWIRIASWADIRE